MQLRLTKIDGIIGDAYDLSKIDLMHASMFWLPAYYYNLFGDLAVKQLGRPTGIHETGEMAKISTFTVFPNPTHGPFTVRLHTLQNKTVTLKVYDETGRFIQSLYDGRLATVLLTLVFSSPPASTSSSLSTRATLSSENSSLFNNQAAQGTRLLFK